MQRTSGWVWKALIVPAYLGYQLLTHSALVQGQGTALAVALAAVPLLLFAYWVVRHARSKAIWTLLLAASAAGVYLLEQRESLGLAAVNAITHTAINAFMLWFFARTLRGAREPLITRFARIFHGTLPPALEGYSRRVTVAWCVFFAAQIAVSALLYAFAPLHVWSLFVNMLSLPLVAAMFIIEYRYRVVRYRNYRHASLTSGIKLFIEDSRRTRRPPLAS